MNDWMKGKMLEWRKNEWMNGKRLNGWKNDWWNGWKNDWICESVRGSFMPLYFPVIICTVFLTFLSSPDAVIGSVFARVIIQTVVLIFTGRSDMVCAFLSLPILTDTITITHLYAWHTSLEHSPPFHLALPAIIITHRYSSLSLPVHIHPSCLFSPRWFPHHLYRHYRDTISMRPFTRWDWHLTSGASTGLWLYMAVRDKPAALPCIPSFVIGVWQYIWSGWTPLKVIDMVDQPLPGVSVISC